MLEYTAKPILVFAVDLLSKTTPVVVLRQVVRWIDNKEINEACRQALDGGEEVLVYNPVAQVRNGCVLIQRDEI